MMLKKYKNIISSILICVFFISSTLVPVSQALAMDKPIDKHAQPTAITEKKYSPKPKESGKKMSTKAYNKKNSNDIGFFESIANFVESIFSTDSTKENTLNIESINSVVANQKIRASIPAKTTLNTVSATSSVDTVLSEMRFGEEGINPRTNNYSITEIDKSMPSPGFTMNISRTFNSNEVDGGPFGNKWSFGFQGYVFSNASGGKNVKLPDGSICVFNTSSYVPYQNRHKLEYIQNVEDVPDSGFVLTTKDNYKYIFSKTNNWLIAMQDKNGNTITIERANTDKRQITKIYDETGSSDVSQKERVFTMAYNAQGYLSTITCPGNQVINYGYDSKGNLTDVYGDLVNKRYYSYTTENKLFSITDGNGNVLDNLITRIGDVNPFIYTNKFGNRFTYGTQNGTYTITDSKSKTTQKVYNQYYDLTSSTDPLGGVTTVEFEGINSQETYYREEKKITDRYGNTIEYKRDTRGNILQQINPDYSAKIYKYDLNNNVIYEADAVPQKNSDGSIKKDSNGNILFTHYKKTFYVYQDATGNTVYGENSKGINKVIEAEPLNGTDEYYSGANEANFAITRYTYGTVSRIKGLLLSKRNPNNHVTTYTYNSNGFIETTKDPLDRVTSKTYNLYGQEKTITTPGGAVTSNDYDNSTNNPTVSTVTYTDATNPDLILTNTSRNEYGTGSINGQPTKTIAPNQYTGLTSNDPGTTYTYYGYGKVHTKTDALGNTTTNEYDIYGNLAKEIRANGSMYLYEYDAINRLTKKSFKSSEDAPAQILEETVYETIPYATPKTVRTEDTKTTHKTYDGLGNVSTTVTYYDMLRRDTKTVTSDGMSVKVYNPNGSIHHQTDLRGFLTYFTYDGLYRTIGKWAQISGDQYSYEGTEYDKAGNVIKSKVGIDYVSNNVIPNDNRCIIKQSTYYNDEKLQSEETEDGKKTVNYYDTNGNLRKQEAYYTSSEKITKEYINNYRGQPLQVKEFIRGDDLGQGTSDIVTLTATNTYDKNGNVLTSTNPRGVKTTNTYDYLNKLLSTTTQGVDESSNITKWYTYTFDGQVATETDLNGNLTSNLYNSQGYLVRKQQTVSSEGSMRDIVTAFDVNLKGKVIRSVSPENFVSNTSISNMNHTEYIYDANDRLIAKKIIYKESPNSSSFSELVSAAYKYDANGNKIKELTGEGFAAGAGSTITDKIDNGYGTEYTYNGANQVLTTRDAVSKERGLGYSTSVTYDGANRKVSETNAKGVTVHYNYDNNGNVKHSEATETVGADTIVHNISNITYDRLGRKTSEADGDGRTVNYEYNDLGKLRSAILPGDSSISSKTINYIYDNTARLIKTTDSTGEIEQFTYDNQDRQLSKTVKNSDGTESITTSKRYDKNGNVRFEIDGKGITTEHVYDALNRKVEDRITVGGKLKSIKYAYNNNGNQIKKIDWLGNVYKNTYDAIGRVIAVDDPYATVQKFEYNRNSAQSKAYNLVGAPGSNTYAETSFSYDKNGRLLVTTKPIGSISQTYDNVGNIATKTDGNGNVTTCQYNYANKLYKVINAKNETTTYTYDNAQNMLQQYDGKNNVTEVKYNVRNLPEKRIDGAGLQETYNYNADGTMSSKTDRNGITTTYSYDVFGRLTQKSTTKNSVEQNVSYTYDNANNQLTMTDSTGTTTRTYDEIGRVLTKTVPVMGTSTYIYDITEGVVGEYSEKTVDPAGNVTEKGYDKACRLISVKDAVDAKPTTYTYDGSGRKTSMTYPNRAKTTYAYDNNNRLVELSNNGTSDVYTYTYDNANNQLSKSEKVNNVSKGTTSYEYDELNRLKKVTEPGNKITNYTFDAAGNRESESVTEGGTTKTTSYSYNGQNRLQSLTSNGSTVNYTYDYNGNVLSNGTVNYTYDAFNRMISADSTNYTYDGDEKRISKTVGGVITNYLYEADKVVLEKDSNGNVTRNVHGTNLISRTIVQKQSTYIGGSSTRMMQIIYDNTAFFQYNGHGDVTRLSDFNGNSEEYTYDAFGNQLSKQTNGNIGNNPFRYAEYMFDEESGLYYLNARYYDAKTARFMSEDDPSYGDVNDPLSLNLYTYCHNEPMMYTDPSGHSWISTIIGVIGGLIAGSGSSGSSSNSSNSGGNNRSNSSSNSSGDNGKGSNKPNIVSIIHTIFDSVFGNSNSSKMDTNKVAIKSTTGSFASFGTGGGTGGGSDFGMGGELTDVDLEWLRVNDPDMYSIVVNQLVIGLPEGYDSASVQLRSLVAFYGGKIKVYKDRVVVTLGKKQQTYYYDIYNKGSTHGNYMSDGKMYVDAVDFGKYFGLTKTKTQFDSFTYFFNLSTGDIGNSIPAPYLASQPVSWSFEIGYIKTPEKTIVFKQSWFVATHGWTAETSIYPPPLLGTSKGVTFYNGKKFILEKPFTEYPPVILPGDVNNYYYAENSDYQYTVFNKQPITASVSFSICMFPESTNVGASRIVSINF